MIDSLKRFGFSPDAIRAISQFKDEPAWMTDLRLAAWASYERLPMLNDAPDLIWQEIRSFLEPPTAPAPSHLWPRDLPHALEERGDEEGLIVQRDSTILSCSLTKEQAKKGVIFTGLETALETAPDLVHSYFAKQAGSSNKWVALSTAFWSGGTFLYIPAHLSIQLPFHACYWMSAPSIGMFPHTLVVVEKGSRISFTEDYVSAHWQEPSFFAAVAEVRVGPNARVDFFSIQNLGRSVHHRNHAASQVAPTGRLHSYRIEMGGTQPPRRLVASVMENRVARLLGSASFSDPKGVESVLEKIPIDSVSEKLRHASTGELTGQRTALTLERVAELHPEVRV